MLFWLYVSSVSGAREARSNDCGEAEETLIRAGDVKERDLLRKRGVDERLRREGGKVFVGHGEGEQVMGPGA